MKIHKEFDEIVSTRIKLTVNMYDSDSSSEELDSNMDTQASSVSSDSLTECKIANFSTIMRQCDFNCFEFMEQIDDKRLADQFYKDHLRGFSADELKQINLSREAYLAD